MKKILRLEIDGVWEPEDFIETLSGIESLYYKSAIWQSISSPYRWPYIERFLVSSSFNGQFEEVNAWFVTEARTLAKPDVRMTVAGINYGSPGSIDLLGIGKVLEVISDTVMRLIVFYSEKKLRQEHDRKAKIENDISEETLRGIKLDNARKMCDLKRDFPDSDDDTFLLLAVNDQDKLIPRIAERKIVNIKSMDSNRTEDNESA